MKFIYLLLMLFSTSAFANSPKIIVPLGTGSVVDIVARKIVFSLGENMIIENRPGAASIVGTNYFVERPEQNHVMITGIANMFMSDITDPVITKFTPDSFNFIAGIADITTSIAGHPNMGNIEKLMKRNDVRVAYVALSQKIALSMMTNGKITIDNFIPYKAGPDMHISTIRGDTFYFFQPLAGVLPHIRSGRLKVYAIGSEKRLQDFPTIPTMKEINKNMSFTDSYVLVAHKNASEERIKYYRQLFQRIESDKEFNKFLTENYLEPSPFTTTHINNIIANQNKNRPLYKKYSQ